MIGSLLTAAARFYLRHPLRLGLAILGVAVGVAVFVGVELANDSARRAFAESESQLVGRATHELVGVGAEIPNALYTRLRREHGPLVAAPVMEAIVRVPALGARRFVLLGVDPLEELDFRDYSGVAAPGQSTILELMTREHSVLIPPALGLELGLDAGSSLTLEVDRQPPTAVDIIGFVDGGEIGGEQANLPLLADIATVQALTGRETISRVDLILRPEQAAAIDALALEGVALVPAPSRSAVFDELSRAFGTNLTALSLLALLVGVFLIYATISFAVLQRRSIFGVYRALGTRRSTLLVSVLLEGAILGTIAAAMGIILGHVLSLSLIELVLRTIGDLYFSTAVRAVPPAPGLYPQGFAVGLGTSLLAAFVPALEGTRVPPRTAMSRAALERLSNRLSLYAAALALPVAACGLLAIQSAPRSLTGAFVGLFLIIVAAALVIPYCAASLLRLAEPGLRALLGLPGALAARGATASLSRVGVATAALAVAIGTVIGVGLMIASFRSSVERWLESTLLADFYVEVENAPVDAESPSANPALARLSALASVRGLSLLQFDRLPTASGPISIRAVLPGPDGWGLTIVERISPDALVRMSAGEGVFVSEALAYRRGLSAGDDISLPTQAGPHDFPILGIYREYNTDGGGVLLPIGEYQAHWQDRDLDGIGVYLTPEADVDATGAAIRGALGNEMAFAMRSTQTIRSRSLTVFDRTFQITEVLRLLAATVAFLGLLSALLSIELDRAKEVGVLRALGLSPHQIACLSLTQTTLLGAVAGMLALPIGLAMAQLLVSVINKRSFGWGMELGFDFKPMMIGVVLAIVAAMLAGIYPAFRLGRGSIVAGLREE